MQTGVIDAVEWVGPYNDAALGLQEVASYYYYPGWHEPGAMLEFIVNRKALLSLPEDLQAIVRYAARATNQDMLDEATARNNASLGRLVDQYGTQLRELPDDVLQALYRNSRVVMQRLIDGDPMARRVYESFHRFHEDVRAYHRISEQSYINARSRVFGESIPGVSPDA
jgi:TRAP-type mannitol/chloroaromatic compound transport system substrate-binding protein